MEQNNPTPEQVQQVIDRIDLQKTRVCDSIGQLSDTLKNEFLQGVNLKAENEQLKTEIAKMKTPAKKPTAKK